MIDAPYSSTRNSFTLLRFVMAALVILCHSYTLLGRTTPLSALTGGAINEGTLAVDAFLTISGFLVISAASRGRNALVFLARRVLRLLPALVCALLFSAYIVGGLAYQGTFADYVRLTDNGPGTWFLNWLTLNVQPEQWGVTGVFGGNVTGSLNVSLWTLKFEVALYLLVALMMLTTLYRRRWAYAVFFGLFLTLRLLLTGFGVRLWDVYDTRFWILSHWNYDRLTETFTFFFAGTLLYAFRREIPRRWYLALICVLTLLLTWILRATLPDAPLAALPWRLTWCIAWPYLVVYLGGSPLCTGFAKVGDLSLGMYVYSYPIQQLLYHAWPTLPPLTHFALTLLIVLPLSTISWRGIEAPALRLKHLKWRDVLHRGAGR